MVTVKTVIAMFAAAVLSFMLAVTIYSYITPKVYVTYASKGTVGGEYYDCVVPSSAVGEDGKIYVVVKKNTVIGTRYRLYTENVTVRAEENGMSAVNLNAQDGVMVVLAHDGRMGENGEVLVYR